MTFQHGSEKKTLDVEKPAGTKTAKEIAKAVAKKTVEENSDEDSDDNEETATGDKAKQVVDLVKGVSGGETADAKKAVQKVLERNERQ